MTKIRWRARENDTTTRITSIEIEVKYDSGFAPSSHIEEIHVYFEPQGGNGLFDRGGGDDVDAIDASVTRPVIFDAGDIKTIDIDETVVNHSSSGWAILWIAFDFSNTANISTGVSCRITQIDWDDPDYPPSPPGTSGSETYPDEADHVSIVNKPVDDHEATFTGTSAAPSSATQGDINVSMLKLDFDLLDTTIDGSLSIHNLYLDSIRLHKTGTPGADSDIDSGGVILYEDTDDSGDLTPADNPIASGTVGSSEVGYVTLSPPVDFPISHTGISPHKTFFIAINISVIAGENNTLGVEIEDPSQDVVFIDLIDDINPISPSYANVSVPYVQAGYILSNTAVSSGILTISELVLEDTIPPEVAYTDPKSNETGVPINKDITVVFSEPIDDSTVTASTITVKDSSNSDVTGTISASGSAVTFTPDEDFFFEELYTVTVAAGVEDLAGNPMDSPDYVWSFTSREDVPKPIAANNRILPGSTDPVKIYIPEPAGGPNEKITVQVYTTTGKRVATLVNNRPYSQIRSQLPLLWYGKNGRQQDLGPGLYFIQVISGSDKSVLKVLIVR